MNLRYILLAVGVMAVFTTCKKEDAPAPSSGLSATPDNNAPTAPVITNPLNNSTDIGSSVNITWSHSTDPENDNIAYNVYLGVTQNNLPIISNGQEQNSFIVTDLEPLTLYYVKVEALDDHSNQTLSDTHQFTTSATVPGNSGPTVPVITAPINNSLDVNSPLIIVWNASTDPDNDNITYNVLLGTVPNSLSVISAGQTQTSYTVNELDLLTEYYVQIEALDDHNHTTPSTQHQFTTSKFGSFTDDRDGKVYGTVKIGNQIWMRENLRYELANESWDYNNNPANSATYGKLYSWSGVNNAVPPGWHLPTDDEWKILESELGMPTADLDINNYSTPRGTDQGTQLQAGGASGMDFHPAGYRYNGTYSALGNRTYLWVNTTLGGDPFRRRLVVNDPSVYRFTNPEGGYAISIRVIKDN